MNKLFYDQICLGCTIGDNGDAGLERDIPWRERRLSDLDFPACTEGLLDSLGIVIVILFGFLGIVSKSGDNLGLCGI